MVSSSYIHIPFCKSKCFYCSFVSYTELELIEAYIKALKTQIRNEYKNEKLKTLYFGGGTPSLVSLNEFSDIVNLFEFFHEPEITIEVNPNDVSIDYLKILKDIGFNRISIGVQCFDDNILKIINRRHNSQEALNAVINAQKAGFNNISTDFIYGLPMQTRESFVSDLDKALSLGVNHISLYGLKLENNCHFASNLPENLPDADMQADMYIDAVTLLEKSGFKHYEISNFAADECYFSKHNLTYWNNEGYYGFGCSASGYNDGVRYTNCSDIKKYINNPLKKEVSNQLSSQEMLEEEIFLGLRKMSGIDVEYINKKFNIDFARKYGHIINEYSDYFVKTEKGFALNLQGTLISNVILAEFID